MVGIEEELIKLIELLKEMVSPAHCRCRQGLTTCHLEGASVNIQGTQNSSGQFIVKYGDFVKDPVVTNTFEAPFGLLKSARKRKIVAFDGEILLSPVHDKVNITLMKETL